MDEDLTYALAMSCIVPALAGVLRYKLIDKKYHPFVHMMMLTALIETIIYLAIKFKDYSFYIPIAVNIYIIVNFMFFLRLTNTNGYVNKKNMQWLLAAAIVICVFNFFYENQTISTNFYYLLCYTSTVMLIITINILSQQSINVKYRLVNNFWFWFSSFSVVYNAFTLLIFGLYFFAMFKTPQGKAIGTIHHIANMVCYLFFALAILKIPKKNNVYLYKK